MPIRWPLLIALCASLGIPAFAQTPATPDLSGTWKLRLAKSKITNSRSTDSETITIRCSGQTIQVDFASSGHPSTLTYVVDGKEHYADKRVSGSVQVLSYYTATWKGSVLFLEFRSHIDDPDHPNIKTPDAHGAERWSLSNDGRVLTQTWIASSTLPGRLFVYDKQ